MKLEMRTLKNIAAAAMTLAVVFGAASLKPVTANAAEASVLLHRRRKFLHQLSGRSLSERVPAPRKQRARKGWPEARSAGRQQPQ